MQDPNIFGSKMFSESIFVGLNLTLHGQRSVYKCSKYTPGLSLSSLAVSYILNFPSTIKPLLITNGCKTLTEKRGYDENYLYQTVLKHLLLFSIIK